MTPIALEPARYGMTGPGLAASLKLQDGFWNSDLGCIDAPEHMPNGSVRAAHITNDGCVYAVTTQWVRS